MDKFNLLVEDSLWDKFIFIEKLKKLIILNFMNYQNNFICGKKNV